MPASGSIRSRRATCPARNRGPLCTKESPAADRGRDGAPARLGIAAAARYHASMGKRRFVVELIKPSHYDDDGYVIQWLRSWIPSNSLACLYAITQDVAARQALGPDVAIEVNAYDECHTKLPIKRIIRRISAA